MKQKFRRFTFVHVCKEMPEHMSHFESDFDAIIKGTSSQLDGGKDIEQYSVYRLKNNKIINEIAWYYESQLRALKKQNRLKAEELVEKYNLR